MVLHTKQILVIFLIQIQSDCKEAKATHNMINTFSPGTAKEHTEQRWFKNFYRELTRALKMRSMMVGSQKLQRSIRADPLTTAVDITKEFISDYLIAIQNGKKIGIVYRLNEWVPHELSKNIF